jgi:hypothetical protein
MRRTVLILALAAFAVVSGRLLERAREEAGIVPSPARIPLGGFEPLFVDILHLRAEAYLMSRQLPEAVAAIRLATELQPRVPVYWEELGSLLAWEYSRSAAEAEVRWRWAREGERVVRRGLEYNPDSPRLLFALGRILLHRMAADPELAPLAARDLGRDPSDLARDAYGRLLAVQPTPYALDGFAAASRLFGERLAARGELAAALAPLRDAHDAFLRIAEDPEVEDAPRILAEIEERIRGIEARIRRREPR